MTHAWIKHIEHAVEELKEIPLWGSPPPFPWNELSKLIGELTSSSHVHVKPQATEWRSHADLLLGLGKKPLHLTFESPTLGGDIHWVMSSEDAVQLLSSEPLDINQVKQFADPRWQEGFISYLALEILRLLSEHEPFGDLSFALAGHHPLPGEGAFCTNVQIELSEKPIAGRLIASRKFLGHFKDHFAASPRALLKSRHARDILLPFNLQAGGVTLPLSSWRNVKVGDCLLLDHCYLDPATLRGTVTLALGKTALFHVTLKNEQVKLLDYAFYFEDQMSDETPIDDEPNEELPSESESGNMEMEEVIPTEEIPIVLTVEIGKLKMSLAKLLELAPGNLLELSMRPEMGVTLTSSGKPVARGELVKIGEALGVKISTIHN